MTATITILIVEDDPAIRHVLHEALLDEGYDVAEATNGQEALDALAACHPDGPAAIVLDLMMPVMDGWHFRADNAASASPRTARSSSSPQVVTRFRQRRNSRPTVSSPNPLSLTH
ncbi:MAG: response regulator [Chloroflexota bacterium]|nr:response regulator [Chloroflexota bacterium]